MSGVSGKVRANNTTRPEFTVNQEYVILGLVYNGGDIWAIVVDDNGDVTSTNGDINGNQFITTELFAGSTEKVI